MNKERSRIAEKLKETKTVVTHFGYDLDNISSTYALELWTKELGILNEDEKLTIERIPAGRVKEGFLNVDTGGHTGNRFEEDTIVIDGDPKNGVNSASASLREIIGIVPEQIAELADTRPSRINVFETRTGLALMKYLTPDKVFELAEAGLLDKQLTDEQLEQYGLKEGHEKQEAIVQTAKSKVEEYTNAGSAVAYEMGINYYSSVSEHKDKEGNVDGVTFAITSKPGVKLPEEVLEYGKELVEEFRIDERTSGAFVNPNGQMVVIGGPKNPEVKLEATQEEALNTIAEKFGIAHTINEVEEAIEDVKQGDFVETLKDVTENENKKDKEQEK